MNIKFRTAIEPQFNNIEKDPFTFYYINKSTDLPSLTPEEITSMVEAADNGDIDLTDYWHVGDSFTINIGSITGSSFNTNPAQSLTFTIVNQGGYELVNPVNSGRNTCSFVVCCLDGLNTTQAWRREMNNTNMLESIPSSIRPIFKQFKTFTQHIASIGSTVSNIQTYFAIPSVFEATGNSIPMSIYKDGVYENHGTIKEGTIWSYFTDTTKRVGKERWLRTSDFRESYSAYYMPSQATTSTVGSTYSNKVLTPFGVI